MAPVKQVVFATCGFASAFASSCTAAECADHTVFLQSQLRKSDVALLQHSDHAGSFFPKLSSLNDPHTRKSALLEIEKTAVQLASLDKTEATDIVVQVCTETAELLNTTVLYAIIEEDAADRASLQLAYDGFDQWETQRQAAEEQIEAAMAVVTQRAYAMVSCRTIETETCVNETICTTEIDDDCTDRDRLELELREIDEEIHRSWCLDGEIRTSTEFRTTTVEVFHRYTEKMTELERAQAACEEMEERCETTLARYIEQATMCSVKKAEMQMSSCEFYHIAGGALTAYQQGFQAALAFYNDVVARVMIAEADRKVEWDVLTRVICLLLTLTNEEDGVVSSAEIEARIQRCWDDFVDVSHLDIDYLDPPDMLSLPELPPMPCTVEYDERYRTGPPAECTTLMEMHNLRLEAECNCLADEIAEQGLILGHYLLIDPDVPMTVSGGEWSMEYDGATYTGVVSPSHSADFSDLSAQMLTPDELDENDDDYTGPVASIAWAYPSPSADFQGSMGMAQRFAFRGGLVFLNAAGQVIKIRELAPASGRLGQPVSATLSFSSAEEITDEQAAAACSYTHPVVEERGSRHYAQGARGYCWVMGDTVLSQCENGCFVYNMVYGKVVFPLIEGMHIVEQ